jgi:phosphatidylglycerophosphatase C
VSVTRLHADTLAGDFKFSQITTGFIEYRNHPSRWACETAKVTISSVPTVAAFDLDGTLADGGSVFKWLRFLRGDRATFFAALTLAGPLFVGAVRSGHWADRAKERLFRKLLLGEDASDVRVRSRTFALAHFENHGRDWVIERLRWHLDQGHDVVIVSASPQIYVDVVAEQLNATGGLGTRLAVDARGKLTGSYLGKNCRGKEKLRRLSEWMVEHHPLEEPVIYAYGNSRGDRRMLRGATFAYDAGRLGPFGALRHFPRLKRSLVEAALTPDE